jgi:hypothetical protein
VFPEFLGQPRVAIRCAPQNWWFGCSAEYLTVDHRAPAGRPKTPIDGSAWAKKFGDEFASLVATKDYAILAEA